MDVKEQAKHIDVTIRIGKNGLSEGQMNELALQLKKRKLVKVKLLRSFIEGKDKKQVFQEIAELTNSKLVDMIGLVGVFYKK